MGLSLGEYSALCFAGAMSFEDGVKVTKARGEAMQAAADLTESGMASVIGLDMQKVGRVWVCWMVYRRGARDGCHANPLTHPLTHALARSRTHSLTHSLAHTGRHCQTP